MVQRTCQTRLFAGKLASFTFWGWQAVIIAAAISLPLGYTSGKEYAELEWPIDILIAIVWISYAIVFLARLQKEKLNIFMWRIGSTALSLLQWHCFIL